jgi:hypothetical protein
MMAKPPMMEPAMAALSPTERPDDLFVELAVGLEFMVGVREFVRDDAAGFAEEVEGIEIDVCSDVVKGLDGDEAGEAFDSRKDQR